jgi:NAD(P)-dependent dehydrogenase (short-subunit alcohol dehydrogenase family)
MFLSHAAVDAQDSRSSHWSGDREKHHRRSDLGSRNLALQGEVSDPQFLHRRVRQREGAFMRNHPVLSVCFTLLSVFLIVCSSACAADDSYRGKVAIVTGSSSGLGAELAKIAADRGMKLVLVDIKPEASEAFAAQVRQQGGEAIVVKVDLAQPEQRPQVIDAALKQFGRIDYLFNNAGYLYIAAFEQTDLQQAHHLFEVNYWAYVDLAHRVVPIMKKQGGGTILNVASVLAHGSGAPGLGHYAASKSALLSIFQSAAQELKADNIRVFVASPGGMRTNMSQNAVGPGAGRMRGGMSTAESPDVVAREIFEKMQADEVVFFPGQAGRRMRAD